MLVGSGGSTCGIKVMVRPTFIICCLCFFNLFSTKILLKNVLGFTPISICCQLFLMNTLMGTYIISHVKMKEATSQHVIHVYIRFEFYTFHFIISERENWSNLATHQLLALQPTPYYFEKK